VSRLPDGISQRPHQELARRRHEPWARRLLLAALVALCALALAGVFGQRASVTTATEPGATLTVDAPSRLRGGLMAQVRIRVDAHRRIAQPRLVLERGWVDGITINTISPEPADHDDDDGRPVLAYGELPAAESLTVRIQIQVNPTTLGADAQDVELRDGDVTIARAERTVTVFP
jgi:hypothetical protein